MKKIISLVICMMCAGLMAFAKPFVPANHEAVVSIYANDKIEWYGEESESTGILNLVGRNKVNNEASDEEKAKLGFTGYLLNDAAADTIEALAAYGFDLVPQEEVLNCDTYTAAKDNKMKKAALMVTPDGYKLFGTNDKQFSKIISETGAEGLISVYFDIAKLMDAGVAKNGKMKACVTVSIEFIGSNGKTLKTFSGFASSEESLEVVAGIYDVEALSAMYPEVIKAALADAVSKIK